MKMTFWKIPVIALAILSLSGLAGAGMQARIGGQVRDLDGNPIQGAVITITTGDMAYEKQITTDKKGRWKAAIIDATKSYTMLVEAAGFQPEQRPFKVMVGSSDNVFDFELMTAEQAQVASQKDVLGQPGYKEFGQARDLYKAGDTNGAMEMLEKALEEMPDLIQATAFLAELNYRAGNMDKALEIAEDCLAEDEEYMECAAIAANAARALGDDAAYSEYMALYQELNPDDPSLLYNEAAVHLNKLDDDGARPLLERCIEVDPEFPECHFEYGMLLLRTGDMEGAKGHLEKYLEVAPDGRDAGTAEETLKYL